MKRILILALICSFGSLYSQDDDNLVVNPSFESVKGKLKKQKQISIATNWESPTELPADLFSTKVKEIVSAPKNVY